MFRRLAIVLASAALGVGASLGVGACGEDRGSVEIEGGTTGGSTTGGSTTGATETAPGTGAETAPTSP